MMLPLLVLFAFFGLAVCGGGGVLAKPELVRGSDVARRSALMQSDLENRFGSFQEHVGQSGVCFNGKPYVATFNLTAPQTTAFVRIDTAPGYSKVVCNLDHTSVEVHFSGAAEAAMFAARANTGKPVLTGQAGLAECEPHYGMFRQVSSVNSTVVEYSALSAGAASTFAVEVRVFKARYDNLIKSGDVKFGPAPSSSPLARVCETPQDPATFCLGVNANKQCTGAAGPIPLYSNSKLSVECSDCYLAFDVTVDLELKLKDFLLFDSHFKFDQMSLSGSMVSTLNAQENWGVNADATLDVISPTNVVQFWLGPIPITIGFELPMRRTAEASFDATANAVVGAQMHWDLGNYEVLWNPLEGWHNSINEPGLAYKTQIEGEAQFQGMSKFGLAPSLTVNIDSFFTTAIDFSAEVDATVAGSTTTEQICANLNYASSANSFAELWIAIPWVNLDKSWKWSKTWFSKTGAIPQKCLSASKINATRPHVIVKPTEKVPATVAPVRASIPARSAGPVTRFEGKDHACFQRKGYTLHYNATMPASSTMLNLDTFSGIKKVTCNAGGNQFMIEFHHKSQRRSFQSQAHQFTTFLTGDLTMSKHCGTMYDKRVFLMRVVDVKDASIFGIKEQSQVSISASRYDEVFQDAEIGLTRNPSLSCSQERNAAVGELSKHVCLGLNSNPECTAAAAAIPLYSSSHLDLTCKNCYVGLEADIFFSLKISDFKLQSLEGGFQNISVNTALVLEIMAQMQWSAGTDVLKDVVPPSTILSFFVGPVPIRLWFEIPLRRTTQLSAGAKASFSAGALATIELGNYYVAWENGKWTVVKPKPTLSWTPTISALTASFQAEALFTLAPTFAFHVDSVFWTTLELQPDLHFTANGTLATKQVCLEGDTRLVATALAKLDINIPFVMVHAGGSWGPSVVYDSGVRQLTDKCVKF